MIAPVILAGGRGTRLWPASRETLPKPYVQGLGTAETLLQATLRRALALPGVAAPLVVCNAAHDFLVRRQAAEMGVAPQLILEPEGRNTAPALCAAALQLSRSGAASEPMLVLPADHAIRDEAGFAEAVVSGAALARQGHLVTFAVEPSFPATGYGYLKISEVIDEARGHYRLERFVEKPNAERAAHFLAEGGYAWNSGMFVFTPEVLITAIAALEPEILEAVAAALGGPGPDGSLRLDREAFSRAPSISIDYAVMEKAPNVATVLARFDWSDVGDWQAVWEMAERDALDNAVSGNAAVIDSSGS